MGFSTFTLPLFKKQVSKIFESHRSYCILLGILGCISVAFWIVDDGYTRLEELQRAHRNQIGAVTLWRQYEQAIQGASPLLPLFDRYRQIPQWNRAKIQHAIAQLLDQYELSLREFQLEERNANKERVSGRKTQKVYLSIGGLEDRTLFQFVHHMVVTMQPWIQIHRLTLQRCGNVDENMLKGLNEDNPNDIVEARFELEWLLNLEDAGCTP